MLFDPNEVKLGKKPARIDEKSPRFTTYLKRAAPPPPPMVDWSKGITQWGMMFNDQLGNCTAAGGGHAIQCWTVNASTELTLTDANIVAFYSATTGYNPVVPTTDQGGVELDVLTWWFNNSFAGHKIVGFPTLDPQNSTNVKQAIALTGGVYIGLQLPISAQSQMIWDLPAEGLVANGAPNSWGGHCVYVVGYDANYLTFITWGTLMKMTWAFFESYCDEAYALVSPDWMTALGLSPTGLDLSTLEADTQALAENIAVTSDSSDIPSPRDPPNHVAGSGILFSIHIGDMVIDIKETVVTYVLGMIGVFISTHAKLDPSSVQTWLGGLMSVVAGAFHLKKVHDANEATIKYKSLVDTHLLKM